MSFGRGSVFILFKVNNSFLLLEFESRQSLLLTVDIVVVSLGEPVAVVESFKDFVIFVFEDVLFCLF